MLSSFMITVLKQLRREEDGEEEKEGEEESTVIYCVGFHGYDFVIGNKWRPDMQV